MTKELDLMTPEEIYEEILTPKPTIDVAKVYETYGTSKKAITNSNVGAIHTADDVIFPDMLGGQTNEEIDEYINRIAAVGMLGALMPMPYHEQDFYTLFNNNRIPSPNELHTYDAIVNNRMVDLKTAQDMWPARQYADTANAKPRVTKRDKVLARRAKDKANRKRARK